MLKLNIKVLGIVFFVLAFTSCRQSSNEKSSVSGDISGSENETIFTSTDWNFESQREEILPVYKIDNDLTFRNNPTLSISGGGKNHSNGCWVTTKEVVPEKFYRFRAHYKVNNVDQPLRTVLARLIWSDITNKQIGAAEYPRTLWSKSPESWDIIEQVYKAPPQAHSAKLELVYRWDADGMVNFGDISFVEVDEPQARKVKLATVYHRPRGTNSSQENLDQFALLVEEAGIQKADIICLPEGMTMVGTGMKYLKASEPIPGPTTTYLGEIAKKSNLYIVAGILERDGEVVYNTAVLIDRKGSLVGKYRKVSLPREEIDGGITPGDTLPVFETDFGRIGIMICWDTSFPEVARTLALRGAEIIMVPIWGGNLTLTQARAIENQVYVVTSTYDMKSAIFNLEGEIMSEATQDNPVAVAEVDLNKQVLWPWLGDFKNRIPREIPSSRSYD